MWYYINSNQALVNYEQYKRYSLNNFATSNQPVKLNTIQKKQVMYSNIRRLIAKSNDLSIKI